MCRWTFVVLREVGDHGKVMRPLRRNDSRNTRRVRQSARPRHRAASLEVWPAPKRRQTHLKRHRDVHGVV